MPHGSPASDTAALLVAELAANAVTHGRVPGRDFELAVRLLGRTLRIKVSDTRGERRPPAPERPAWHSGRSPRTAGACCWWRRSPTGGT